MKKYISYIALITLVYVGCDLVDGTGTENPDLTLDQATAQQNSAQAWVRGLDRRIAILYNSFLTTAELTTDNYVNKATFFNQNVDNGAFRDTDSDIIGTQFQFARLREEAVFGLADILDLNPEAQGTELEAEMQFYKGYSHLVSAEVFVALPAEGSGVPQTPETHFQAAIEAFTAANSINSSPSYLLGLARAHYGLGNQSEAVQFAQAAINASPNFIRFVEFDGVNGPTNTYQNAVYDRNSFNDLQPLPRLDFLDPKYGDLGGTDESPIAFQKSEEAFLIIAEAQLADNQLNDAKQTMLELLALVDSRPIEDVDEGAEGRVGTGADTQRPNSSQYVIASEPGAPFREGLVLDRTASTPTPRVSGTSVTSDIVNDIATVDDALYYLYLLRQEIFFGEGRRIADLGIKWPIGETEALNNPNVEDSQRVPFIPSYIPSNFSDMDTFEDSEVDEQGNSIDAGVFEVVITVDMNRVLVENRGNRFN